MQIIALCIWLLLNMVNCILSDKTKLLCNWWNFKAFKRNFEEIDQYLQNNDIKWNTATWFHIPCNHEAFFKSLIHFMHSQSLLKVTAHAIFTGQWCHKQTSSLLSSNQMPHEWLYLKEVYGLKVGLYMWKDSLIVYPSNMCHQ